MLAAQILIQVLVVINSEDALPQTPGLWRVLEGANAEAVAEHQLLIERGCVDLSVFAPLDLSQGDIPNFCICNANAESHSLTISCSA
jgi:hypothetical protein